MRGLLISLCVPAALLIPALVGFAQEEKIRVTRLDELPTHTYAVTGKASDLLATPDKIGELSRKLRADVETDLEKYAIDDPSTLQRLYGILQTLDLFDRDYDAALSRLERIRALEDKEAKKLTLGLETEASAKAAKETGQDPSNEAFKIAFRRALTEKVMALPFPVVQDAIQESKGRMEILSENLLKGLVQAQMDPVTTRTGELDSDQAAGLISIHLAIRDRLPLKEEIVQVYQEAIEAHLVVKPDIWSERAVTLAEDQNLTPVLVGIWDSGTDPSVFPDRLFVNPGETLDNRDDDGNGYIDDVHGIAFDIDARRTTGMLYPLGDAAARIDKVMAHMKGFMDLQADIDSPEAAALKKHLASIDPKSMKGLIEDLSLAGNYSHGTHVAGIVAQGNPYAFLLIARLSYDHRMVPVARTVEWAERDAQKCRDTVAYFKDHGVRVVNMSWGEAQADAESSLELNGLGKDADERRQMAREVFAIQKKGLFEAIQGAPRILFVCAAGNSDNDVAFDEDIPSSFELPNLLVVGAVDQAGDPTSFTSSGKTVTVYASGFEVKSYVPGGQEMEMSGTSMASPNVANLAAKILAVQPKLTPGEVIALIREGGEVREKDGRSLVLIHPKNTMALLKEGHAKK